MCAYTRKIIHCYSPSRDSYGVLAANKNELAARALERVSVLVLVLWLSARLRRAAALAGCWCHVIVRGVVSWLRRLRTFLFQPVACQQVVGFCLAIWGCNCFTIIPQIAFLLQINELPARAFETVAGAAAGAGAVSWLCTWWRPAPVLVLGAGRRRWCCELAVHVVETVAGAGVVL